MTPRQQRAQPRRELAAAVEVVEQRPPARTLRVEAEEISDQRIRQILPVRPARDRDGGAVQLGLIAGDERVPRGLVSIGAGHRQREIFEVKRVRQPLDCVGVDASGAGRASRRRAPARRRSVRRRRPIAPHARARAAAPRAWRPACRCDDAGDRKWCSSPALKGIPPSLPPAPSPPLQEERGSLVLRRA